MEQMGALILTPSPVSSGEEWGGVKISQDKLRRLPFLAQSQSPGVDSGKGKIRVNLWFNSGIQFIHADNHFSHQFLKFFFYLIGDLGDFFVG